MGSKIYHIEFHSLRNAYREVKSFIENEALEEVGSLKTRIAGDLGINGDDNYDMLAKFVTKYNLDVRGFDYTNHFLSEGELYGSDTVLIQILLLPVYFLNFILRILGRQSKSIVPNIFRSTTDLTFRDMITWYVTGRFHLRQQIKFQIG